MSLMRLLSVSRSFCSSVPEMGRYKLSKRGSLPDFGRRVDGATTPRRATQGELAIGAVSRRKAETGQSALRLEYVGTEPRGEIAGDGPASVASQVQPQVPQRALETVGGASKDIRLSRWFGWLALQWSAWTRRRTRRRPRRGPVQTAFQLETVRVMRNDLTEADLEFVVMKARRSGRGDGVDGGDGGVERSRPLARLAARLFTAGRPE